MKRNGLRRLLLAVGLFVSAAATPAVLSAASRASDGPLQVSRLELRVNERHYSLSSAQGEERVGRDEISRRRTNNIYAPYLGVRNTSAKTVVKVKWEVVLYRDQSRGKVLRTYTYRSKREIRPGEEAVLRGPDLAYPTSDFNHPYEGKIVEVTYSDGTTWARS